jgi:hypothetical protein
MTRFITIGVLTFALVLSVVGQVLAQENEPPTTPMLLQPAEHVIIDSYLPTLWFLNSDDPDGDQITYNILITPDSLYGDVFYATEFGYPEGQDSTSYQFVFPIDENNPVWWTVQAEDSQGGKSSWSVSQCFWVDSIPEAPTAPRADFPGDSAELPLFEMMPVFSFRQSLDPDPFDTVYYRLEIANDSLFTLATVFDSIPGSGTFIDFALCDSLAFGAEYFWRVVAVDKRGMTATSDVMHFWTWLPGDMDHSHQINIVDLVFLVTYMFQNGPPADPAFVMDLNGDCTAPDIADLIHLVQYMFSEGCPPEAGCLTRSGLL